MAGQVNKDRYEEEYSNKGDHLGTYNEETVISDASSPNQTSNAIKSHDASTKKEADTADADQTIQDPQEDINSAWTTVWDDNSQSYYWWNTISNETSWENPIANEAADQTDAADPTSYYSNTEENDPYRSHAYFNERTGKFTAAGELDQVDPQSISVENRATRQMQYYFDVDAYMEQRNKERQMGNDKKRPLTKRDIQRFKKIKQKKKDKRAREWLLD